MSVITPLEAQIRECYSRTIYTHKTHEKMADLCANTLRWFKILQIILSAVASSGIVAAIFIDSMGLKVAAAILSLANLFLTGYMKGFDPGGTAQKNRDAAAQIWLVRESYLSLLTDVFSQSIPPEEAMQRRNKLQEKMAVILKAAPQTSPKAYRAAQKALKQDEEYTFSDDEIDYFLPKLMRRGARAQGEAAQAPEAGREGGK